MARQHVVLLAFADARGELPELHEESRQLQALFESFARAGRCKLKFRPNVTLEQLYQDLLAEDRDQIAIVHYGGHADAGQLMLEEGMESGPAHAKGLATLLGRLRGLKLVFLNGCSTRPQVQRLLEVGVSAVIATARSIDDRVARKLSVAFYQALTTGGEGVKKGQSLASAFGAAQAYVTASRGGVTRDLVAAAPAHDDVTDPFGLPWDLQVRKGAEQVERWNLFDNDPLFGLPDLPNDIGLPAEPFRNLECFDRAHARIFAGRGRAIRELYDLVTRPLRSAPASVLLYYGQTGVGKTSVLTAGLLPRLEELHQVRYLRAVADRGLLGTLRAALAPGSAEPFDLGQAWLALEHSPDGRPLVVVLDQCEEIYTRPLVARPAGDESIALSRSWIDPEAEVQALVEAVRKAFDPTRPERLRGKLILGFRKEWLDEFERACRVANLEFDSVPLGPLDRAGIVEAIEGPAREPDLDIKEAKHRLRIQPEDPPMAESIADDLLASLADPNINTLSPIAPTLQVLLTRMWAEARRRDRDRPTFGRSLYTELKAQGYQLGEVLDQQLEAIAHDDPEAVQKGLLLDLLEWFTTPLGTAASHTKAELHGRYPQQLPHRLDALVQACQREGRYLLVETRAGTGSDASYRLVHDTLAPLVRERFRLSMAPAQRARRLVEHRAPEWKGRDADPVLDRFALQTVEDGLPWARAPIQDEHHDEPGLIAASRETVQRERARDTERQRQLDEARKNEERARAERQKETEMRLKQQEEANRKQHETNRHLRQRAHYLLGALLATLLFAAYAYYQRGVAHQKTEDAKKAAKAEKEQAENAARRERIAEGRRLASESGRIRESAPTSSLLLAAEAVRVTHDAGEEVVDEADEALRLAIVNLPCLVLSNKDGATVTAIVAMRNGRFATGHRDGTVRVWSPEKPEPLATLRGHEGVTGYSKEVTALVALGDGRLASGGAEGTICVWELDYDRLLDLASRHAGRNMNAQGWQLYFGGRPYRRTFPAWPPGPGVEGAVQRGRVRLDPRELEIPAGPFSTPQGR
jgi:hypothetical protein